MKLGNYGMRVKENMEKIYPLRFQELVMDGTIMERLLEREQELIYQAQLIEEQLKKKKPIPKTNEFQLAVKYKK